MSKTVDIHSALGVIAKIPGYGIILAHGTTVPADGTAGFAPGCQFYDLNAAAGLQWFVNEGSITSCDFNAALPPFGSAAALTSTIAELNKLDDSLSSVVMSAGAGVSAAETYKNGVFRNGSLITTRIVVDLTGLVGSATDRDIIGNTGGAASANFGQILTAVNGVIAGGQVTCLEVPAGGTADIDFESATVGTGAQDALITSLTNTSLVTSGGAWTSGLSKGMTTVPPANDFLYICNGAAAGGTFSAGKFLIELYGA